LLDTGAIVRFSMVDDPAHPRVTAKLEALAQEGWELCVSAQAMREGWNVLTRPVENGGYGLLPEKIDEVLRGVEVAFTFVEETPAVFRQWRRLAVAYGLRGKSVHDANVVATALVHGASHLLTPNERDFRRYAEIALVVP
jgi:predicted nucleic acid-binding protein